MKIRNEVIITIEFIEDDYLTDKREYHLSSTASKDVRKGALMNIITGHPNYIEMFHVDTSTDLEELTNK